MSLELSGYVVAACIMLIFSAVSVFLIGGMLFLSFQLNQMLAKKHYADAIFDSFMLIVLMLISFKLNLLPMSLYVLWEAARSLP